MSDPTTTPPTLDDLNAAFARLREEDAAGNVLLRLLGSLEANLNAADTAQNRALWEALLAVHAVARAQYHAAIVRQNAAAHAYTGIQHALVTALLDTRTEEHHA